ncbi:MAG: precorrin-2 C(20)-methyltransferase [Mycobacteriales bacterium]
MKLVGVGVGPGDPELVTVKALRVLREATAVVVPVLDRVPGPGRAEATVRAHLGPDAPVHRVPFALSDTGGVTARRAAAWDAAGALVARLLTAAGGTVAGGTVAGGTVAGGTVAFATLGDPNVYSTFSYLAQTVRALLPGVEVATVPGITALQDLAARAGVALAEGGESLALFPLTAGLDAFGAALGSFDTVVGYKGGARLGAVLDVVAAAGRLPEAVVGAALGLPDETVGPATDFRGRPAPYLATLLVPPRRTDRGGRL